MAKILKKVIDSCKECPYFATSFKNFPYRMICKNMNQKIIATSGSPNLGKKIYEIPDWCPLEDKD